MCGCSKFGSCDIMFLADFTRSASSDALKSVLVDSSSIDSASLFNICATSAKLSTKGSTN